MTCTTRVDIIAVSLIVIVLTFGLTPAFAQTHNPWMTFEEEELEEKVQACNF